MTIPANSLNITQPGFALFDSVANFYAPNKILSIYDDFLATDTNTVGQLDWVIGFPQNLNGTATHPGLLSIVGNANGNQLSLSDISAVITNFVLGSGTFYNNFVFDIGALSVVANRYTAYIGLTDAGINGINVAPTSGVYFQYSDNVNSGNWQIVCNDNSVSTVVNTSIPAATGFHNYGFVVNAAGTSVVFTIDGVVAGTVNSNIPTLGVTPGLCAVVSAGNAPTQIVDLFYMTLILTTAR